MKGTMKVDRLRKSGNYVSTLDYDKCYMESDNPKGLFKMVIEPIENSEGYREIRYMRTEQGILVSGEGYLISAESEKEIDEKCMKHTRKQWPKLIQREVSTEDQLW